MEFDVSSQQILPNSKCQEIGLFINCTFFLLRDINGGKDIYIMYSWDSDILTEKCDQW